MSTQDLRLFDLLDGFEMTKSEYDWLERRFENMTVKEALLFRGAMQIERPEKTCDVMQVINQLDHYELFYGAGDDAGLGRFVMEQIKRPASPTRAYLNPAKVGAAYRQRVGSAFCDGHFIKISSLTVPLLDSGLTQYPDKGDYGIRVKLASRSNMNGVWVGFPDTSEYMDSSHPDELLLALDALEAETLYPDGWQQHSYVALCGTAEHAMLWMLEKNPNLRKAILCLDHDAAGIEAVGRLSEVLREHGYSQIAPLQSEYKDWDEDLKARHGLEAQPAEDHPQFAVAGLVCRRIGARCKEVRPDRAVYQFPGLLLRYRNDLHWGHFDQAMERMETMAALALSVVLRECKQMGTALTTEQGVRFLESHILPHQNRGILKNRADEIAMQFQSVLAKNKCQGIRTQAEKKEVASAWLELAISCAKVPVKYEADEIKRRQKEEKTQREAEPVMA